MKEVTRQGGQGCSWTSGTIGTGLWMSLVLYLHLDDLTSGFILFWCLCFLTGIINLLSTALQLETSTSAFISSLKHIPRKVYLFQDWVVSLRVGCYFCKGNKVSRTPVYRSRRLSFTVHTTSCSLGSYPCFH